jgi:acyl dehydratase
MSLEAGQEIEPFVVESVDPGRMKTMAMLLRDPNPIHWDPASTSRLGLGDVPINQGPTNVSFLIEAAIRAAGSRAGLRRFRARLVRNVFAGDRLECRGKVVSVDEAAGTAELELNAFVGDDVVVAADATVAYS